MSMRIGARMELSSTGAARLAWVRRLIMTLSYMLTSTHVETIDLCLLPHACWLIMEREVPTNVR